MSTTPPEKNSFIIVHRERIEKWEREFRREAAKAMSIIREIARKDSPSNTEEEHILPAFCEYFSACFQAKNMLELVLEQEKQPKVKLMFAELLMIQAVDSLMAIRRKDMLLCGISMETH